MTVTLYADADGALSFHASEGATPVEFELAEGYSVGEGFTGVKMIVGPPGTLGLSMKEAISKRVLRPVFDKRIASTEGKS